MAAVTLHYFPLYARAETARIILKSKGVEYVENVITFEHWPSVKQSGDYEFHQLPLLEIDGHKLVTSGAIERYLSRKYSLYPEDPYQAYLVESVIDLKNDQVNKFVFFKFTTKDEEGLAKWASTQFIDNLKLIEARLVANGGGDGYFVGAHATWADFSLFQFLHDAFYRPENEQHKPYFEAATPKLKAFVDRFLATEPHVAEWIASRPQYTF
eukprot:CAMPEP_0204900074 /NCGR_PEP_ID=MMETSP1397-20131031/2241_1 /ASSEMBLY_ACC=CAM_ASM_000891 /TAXON_ID=49980 /ORGANISM="Climacostomum Climacostomum virens, Strain Stock W-24" /LENGTH=211 /DNA_ID=CAMNT_0052068145 /DNA_START=57 /DNA_END=692 /DNA_ORIENTATION=-